MMPLMRVPGGLVQRQRVAWHGAVATPAGARREVLHVCAASRGRNASPRNATSSSSILLKDRPTIVDDTNRLETTLVASTSSAEEEGGGGSPGPGAVVQAALPWGALALLTFCYLQQSWSQFSLPIMLPAITADLRLSDVQGGALTTGYTYLYAFALPPVGMLADRMRRPTLLAAGVASWSALTLAAAGAKNFGELLGLRVGFAAAQGVQNPISFALIAELFPQNKSTALAIYNCSLYFGRALSFGSALAAEKLGELRGAAAVVVATSGVAEAAARAGSGAAEAASRVAAAGGGAVAAVAASGAADPDAAWRDVLRCTAVPGFVIALALLMWLPEPKDAQGGVAAAGAASGGEGSSAKEGAAAGRGDVGAVAGATGQGHQEQLASSSASPSSSSSAGTAPEAEEEASPGILSLIRNPAFMSVTVASAFNDLCSYALLSWLSTFYERTYHMDPSQYAPVMAVILPVGGIIGGVGGGWVADQVAKRAATEGGITRAWITGGTNAAAAPLMALAFSTHDSNVSFFALMAGYAMSEAWRAPAGNMARSCAPASMSATAVSLYLSIRCMIGGLGPLGVALLTQHLDGDISKGMLLIPVSYLISGAVFNYAEGQFHKLQALASA